ncbi:hypothetical protein FRC01_003650 [Tulasnella sp. 417]|nr:hypothetical protein FRC01_003650 [Tulasnella sp. 417]
MALRLTASNLLKRTVQPSRIIQTLSRAALPQAASILTGRAPPLRHFSSKTVTPQQIRHVRFGRKPRWRPFKDGQWDTRSKILVGLSVAGGLYFLYHLERVEETGRLRFIDVSPEQEREYGRLADEDALEEYAGKILPACHPLACRITEIASRIITAANLGEVKYAMPPNPRPAPVEGESILPVSSDDGNMATPDMTDTQKGVAEQPRQEWEVCVIKDDSVPNAFINGGGKIFIFTGILPIAANEDGVATVIGHEIAHQVQRHSAEKFSGAMLFVTLAVLLEILGLAPGLSHFGLTLFASRRNSRQMESEADNIGLRLMAQACFDPRESVRMWERMCEFEKQQGGGGLFSLGLGDFLRTHPTNEKRIEDLQKWIPNALVVRAASSCAIDDRRTVGDEFLAFLAYIGL